MKTSVHSNPMIKTFHIKPTSCLAGILALSILAAGAPPRATAADGSAPPTPTPTHAESDPLATPRFDAVAGKALAAMKARANELGIQGVAVIGYFEGEQATGWSSRMLVIGKMKNPPSGTDSGANLLAIAYAKATEMVETLKPSGSAGRPPMKGELGWQGGWIQKGRSGYLVGAFSGGKSEDDVKVSRAGVDILATVL